MPKRLTITFTSEKRETPNRVGWQEVRPVKDQLRIDDPDTIVLVRRNRNVPVTVILASNEKPV